MAKAGWLDHRNADYRQTSGEGLNVLQYFISTHGARKGLGDNGMEGPPNFRLLTTSSVDVAQDLVITETIAGN